MYYIPILLFRLLCRPFFRYFFVSLGRQPVISSLLSVDKALDVLCVSLPVSFIFLLSLDFMTFSPASNWALPKRPLTYKSILFFSMVSVSGRRIGVVKIFHGKCICVLTAVYHMWNTWKLKRGLWGAFLINLKPWHP